MSQVTAARAWCGLAVILLQALVVPGHLAADHVKVRDVAAGSAELVRDGNELRIRTDDGTVINYDRFDVPRDHLVEFQQPHEAARVLNRIHSETPSHINGALHANGIVYFANPAGVVFGPEAMVDVGQLRAVAGHITDDDFLHHRDRFVTDDGELIHEGRIRARGDVSLIGAKVASHGLIRAPQGVITLAAGDETFLQQQGSTLLVQVDGLDAATGQATQPDDAAQADEAARPDDLGVQHTGEVEAEGVYFAVGDVYSMALENGGTVKASGGEVTMAGDGAVRHDGALDVSSDEPGGRGGAVRITGERIDVDGTIDARGDAGGGTIHLGGEKQGQGALRRAVATVIGQDARIDASATGEGGGGSVIAWADEDTEYAGRINARGGERGGDGGFVEVSGKRRLNYRGLVDLTAPRGEAGRLLLDPTDITIALTGEASETDLAFDDEERTFHATDDADASLLSAQTLEQQLAFGHVTVTTESDGDGDGDITIEDSFGWESDFDLTLLADRNITFDNDAQIAQTGGGSITLRADRTGVGEDRADGTVIFGSGAALNWLESTGDVTILYNVADYAFPERFDTIGHVHMGDGEYHELMLVNTAERLQAMRDNRDGHYALGRDIDAGVTADGDGAGFEPVGHAEQPFTGTLDGRGRRIAGLEVDGGASAGLFGVTENATIRDLGLTDVRVTGDGPVGGLIGQQRGGTVRDSFVTGTVEGAFRVGGLIGAQLDEAVVTRSHFHGTVVGHAEDVGGLAGRLDGLIADSYALARVSGGANVGALVGHVPAEAITGIVRAHAGGPVHGDDAVGGFIGRMDGPAEIHASFFNVETTGVGALSAVGAGAESDGMHEVIGRTSAELMQAETFAEVNWDLGGTWTLIEGVSFPFHHGRLDEPRVVSGTLADVGSPAQAPDVTLTFDRPVQLRTHAGADGFYQMLLDAGSLEDGWFESFMLVQVDELDAHALVRGDGGHLTGIDLAPESLALHQAHEAPLGNAFLAEADAALEHAALPWSVDGLDVSLDEGLALEVRDAPFALAGDVVASGDMAFEAIELEADATLETTDTIQASAIDGPGDQHALTLTSGEGVEVTGTIGLQVGDVTLNEGALRAGVLHIGGRLTADADVTATDIDGGLSAITAETIDSTANVVAEEGTVSADGLLRAASVTSAEHIFAGSAAISGATTAAGTVSIADEAAFGGPVTSAREGVHVGGHATFATGATAETGIGVGGPVTLTGDATFTAPEFVIFLNTVDGDGESPRTLEATAHEGMIQLAGAVGGQQPLERVTLEAPFIDLADVATTGEQSYTADFRLAFRGAATLDGATLEARVLEGMPEGGSTDDFNDVNDFSNTTDSSDVNDFDDFDDLGLFVTETASVDSGGGDVRLINEAGTGVVIDGPVTSAPGDGGELILANATVNVTPTPGAGDIEIRNLVDDGLDPPDAPIDLLINDDIVEAITVQLEALRDIVVNALIQTTAGDADVILVADADQDGEGGVHVTDTGRIDSGRDVLLVGTERITADPGAQISGGGQLRLQPHDPERSIGVAGGEGELAVSEDLLMALEPGFTSILIGRADGAHVIDIRAATFRDPVTFRAPRGAGEINIGGELLFTDDAGVVFLGPGETTNLAADIATEGNPITFADAVIVEGERRLDTTAGDTVASGAPVTFGATTDAQTAGMDSLTIDAGVGGEATFAGGVGQQAPLGGLAVERAARVAVSQPVTVAGDVTVNVSETFTQAGEATIRTSGSFDVTGDGTAAFGAPVLTGVDLRLAAADVPSDVLVDVAGAVARQPGAAASAAAAAEAEAQDAAIAQSLAVLGLGDDTPVDPLFARLFRSQWRGFEQQRAEGFGQRIHAHLVERGLTPGEAVAQLREGDRLYDDLVELAAMLDLIEAMGLDEAQQRTARQTLLDRLRPGTVPVDDLEALVTATRRALRMRGR